jgi:Arc/MetJ-type ribon-helix-helix transcriptional regulator
LAKRYYYDMKAVTINISLNLELAEFARSDSQEHAFDSMSEYMRDLIRRRRRERIDEDVALLEKAMAEAPMGEPSEQEIAGIIRAQHSVRAERKRARRS